MDAAELIKYIEDHKYPRSEPIWLLKEDRTLIIDALHDYLGDKHASN